VYLLLARLMHAGSRRHVIVLAAGFVSVVIVGGLVFAAVDGIAVTTGWYWAITTATTVGYGDISPHSGGARVVASIVMLTAIPMLGTLFAVVTGASISAGLRRFMQMDKYFPTGPYRLVVGSHPTVPAILAELLGADESVVLVADVDPSTVPDAVHFVRGDPTDSAAIAKARPAGAQHALITAVADGDVLVSAVLLHQQAPDLAMTALTNSGAVRHALAALGVQQTVSVNDLVAHTLAKSIETPHAGQLVEELFDSTQHCLVEVPAEADVIGKQLSAIRREQDGLVLGIVQSSGVNLGIGGDPVVAAGDQLLIATVERSVRSGA
jgi:voltage-gated potassium channel